MIISRYFELIVYKAYADLKSEAARTYISFMWWILDPLLYMAVFYVVFEVLLRRGTDNYVSFLMVGLTFWKWFASSIQHAVNSISMHRGLIQQIYLPKMIFPVITFITDLVKFGIVFVMLLVFLVILGNYPGLAWLSLPFLIFCQMVLILGFSCLVAAVTPWFPDLRVLTESALMLLMFLSGIFYESSQIPDPYLPVFFANPMAVMIESFRQVLLTNQLPSFLMLGYVLLVGFVALAIALIVLTKLDRAYPRMALT